MTFTASDLAVISAALREFGEARLGADADDQHRLGMDALHLRERIEARLTPPSEEAVA